MYKLNFSAVSDINRPGRFRFEICFGGIIRKKTKLLSGKGENQRKRNFPHEFIERLTIKSQV